MYFFKFMSLQPPHSAPPPPNTHTHFGEREEESIHCVGSETCFLPGNLPWLLAVAALFKATEQQRSFRHPLMWSVKHLQVFAEELLCARGFPLAQSVKSLTAMQETWVGIPGSGRSPGEGNCNPLQYSCLENPMDSGDWQATVSKSQELDMIERLSTHTHTHTHTHAEPPQLRFPW